MAFKELVKVARQILINFKIYYNLNTISFNGKKLKVISGEL